MRTSFCPGRGVVLIATLVVVAVSMMIAGCGNSATDTGVTASPTAGPARHTAASGQAITDKLSFSQLTLESPSKPSKDKHGLTFLHFKYADNDGKVYECVLPLAMSEGQYTLSEWSSTFNAYRLPKVLAQKKVTGKENLGDFPFISPKPQAQQENQSSQPSGPTMPTLPGPSAPPAQPGGPHDALSTP